MALWIRDRGLAVVADMSIDPGQSLFWMHPTSPISSRDLQHLRPFSSILRSILAI